MTHKTNFLIFTAISFLVACTSTPFTELNSRDNFQLEEETGFKIQLNKDLLPVEMDPILIENLGDAAKEYLEGVGHQFSKDAAISIDLSVTTKEKIKYDDFRFYGYPMYRSYRYEPDRINSVPEFFLRISVRDDVSDKTLWTGLTKWRKGSSYAPIDVPSAEMLVENLLVNL
ncbi:MAG: hypothetical protein ACJ0FQ_04410 [Gammaproteobacteria bacterium]|nr:MAG: hypothetical protein CBD96_000680 [Gammaproteobacteria bacterium TMED236]